MTTETIFVEKLRDKHLTLINAIGYRDGTSVGQSGTTGQTPVGGWHLAVVQIHAGTLVQLVQTEIWQT
jgi:hypothetical protein